ncbi:MAG: sigma-70 family RNA polymerase sigma factor [Treponema sp.]|jgi:RNA polymerase sigma-70 factor (ECF subfamily)|nr:sigma-70 family RNA polymerase sigma factor [Treponema sp.]
MKSGAAFSSEGAASFGIDDDLILLEQILAGQKELFRLLVKRYQKAVYGMGVGFFHNREDASDFTQEVFLKVYRSLSKFEGRSRFSTWLYKIAYNTGLNHIKRKKDYQSLAEEEEIVSDENTPEKKMLRGFIKDSILEALKGLPERFRICVDLFFFYDRSLKEIEAITGYPVNTVKSNVFRAKKLLRNKLEGITEGGIE